MNGLTLLTVVTVLSGNWEFHKTFDANANAVEDAWRMVCVPELGVSSRVVDGKRVQVEDESRFPTVVEGFVEGGRLRVRVHNVLRNCLVGEFNCPPRDAAAFSSASAELCG